MEHNSTIPNITSRFADPRVDFAFKRAFGTEKYKDGYILHYVCRETESGGKMPGSTEYIFLGLQDFNKKENELTTYPEKWLYLEQRYITDMMNDWDIANAKREACEEAKAEGRAEGLAEGVAKSQREIAKKMLSNNIEIEMISKCTGLTGEEIKAL